MNNLTEKDIAKSLVSRIIQGDRQAEKEMVERYQRGLIFMLKRKADDIALAEDIAQETWRIVIEKVRANSLNNAEKLAAFIVQIGKNQLLMHFRSSHNKKMTHQENIEENPDTALQPEKILERHNLAMIVRRMIDELKTDRDRQLILRFYIDEENKSSICHDLELSELHFNRVLFRARQRFKQLWMTYIEDKS